jgi:hypothetical protein
MWNVNYCVYVKKSLHNSSTPLLSYVSVVHILSIIIALRELLLSSQPSPKLLQVYQHDWNYEKRRG